MVVAVHLAGSTGDRQDKADASQPKRSTHEPSAPNLTYQGSP